MTLTPARYADWKAPAADADVVVWPAANVLLEDLRANHRDLSVADRVLIQNVPLPALRREQRRLLDQPDDQPLIASGHQTELYHPGVWVKDVLASALAARTGARAAHIAVDTDQPKHLNLRWPGTTLPISDDPAMNTAAWSGLIAPPTSAHLQAIRAALPALERDWRFQSHLPPFLQAMSDIDASPPGASTSLSGRLTAAQHRLDQQLGVRYDFFLIGPVAAGHAPYLAFAHHVLANAERFAADYNAALAAYRDEAGIASPTRPMPDLQRGADSVEMPFWLDDLQRGTRRRAEVRRVQTSDAGSHWTLQADADAFTLDAGTDGWAAASQLGDWLRRHQLRLSPRALTLTMFLRLLLVDQFVHGIGGGRYDQVTDRLIHAHFGLQPPRFAVATATLLFPGALGRTRVCLPCMVQEGHRLKHGLLGKRKAAVLAELNALPRRSLGRSMAFHNLHAALSAAAADSDLLRSWESRYAHAQDRDRQDIIIFDRELFYGIQTSERLATVVDRVDAALDGVAV